MNDKVLISFMKSLKNKKTDEKEETKAFRRVAYTINGIHRSILLTYGNISSFNTNKKADELFRKKKLLLNYYTLDAIKIISYGIEHYNYLDFIFPGACILIGEYDSRICKLKTYINQLLMLKEFLKNNSHLSIGLWYWELSRLS